LAKEIHQLEEYVRGVPKIKSDTEITLPGDPERRIRQTRRTNGIPLDDGNWKALVDLAKQLGIACPAVSNA
jgi:uncharacterized oxidoreductase